MRYTFEYKVGDETMLLLRSADGEGYVEFMMVCMQVIAQYEAGYPQYQHKGYATIEDHGTTRRIW